MASEFRVPLPHVLQSLRQWQQQVLNGILRGLVVVGLLAFIMGVQNAYQVYQDTNSLVRFVFLVVSYLIIYMVVVLVTFLRRVTFRWRVGMVLAVFYGLGLIGLLEAGLIGDGRLFLFGFVIMTAIFLDLRYTIGAVALSLLTFLGVGWLHISQQTSLLDTLALAGDVGTLSDWVTGAFILLLITVAVVISLVHLMNGLKLSLTVSQKAEERYRTLYEHTPSMYFTVDEKLLIVSVNQFGASQLGYTTQELTDVSILELTPGKAQPALQQELARCFEQSHQLHQWNTPMVKKDGNFISVVEFARVVPDLEGRLNIFLVCQDVTEQKELEEKLRQAQKMEAIGRLAGGVAHDFNNLLVPIIGYVDLAMIELSEESKLYADLMRVKEAAQRAADLTRQILAFSRRQVLEMRVLNLNEVVEGFKQMIQSLIGEDIELQTSLARSLYPVRADRAQIEQVLMNLVLNARDAMPQGGKLVIETENAFLDAAYIQKYATEQSPGYHVMLAVSDTGHGMVEETKECIFEPFFTTKENGKGTGLGLATVFGIVQQHQGNIWVYSELGIGTTFKIYLPCAEADDHAADTTTPEPVSMYGTEAVMVVEDEAMVRKLVCETLETHGYRILEAGSPSHALQLASSHQGTIHLLVTDVIMPEMNGRDLYQKVAAIHPDIRVLYMSGYTDNVIVNRGVLDEGLNFLQKPFTIRTLTRKVRQALS